MPWVNLSDKSGRVSFRYFDDLDAARAQGFRGYPGLRLGRKANERIGFEQLRRRLPLEKRRDYGKTLKKFNLPADLDRGDHLTLLAYTGARHTNDSFSICETFDGFDKPFRFLFDLANVKHAGTYDVCAKLTPEEALTSSSSRTIRMPQCSQGCAGSEREGEGGLCESSSGGGSWPVAG